MKTSSIGEILSEQRTKHRLSVAEFALRTKIKPQYLVALENNEFEKLPAASFVRGYIRAYARTFGFDAQPVYGLLRRDFKESDHGTLVPREFLKPALKKRQLWTPASLLVVAILAAFVAVFSYVAVQWYTLNQPPKLTIFEPKEDAFVSAKIIVSGETVPDAFVLINAQPVSLQTDGSFTTEVYLPREGISTITIEARDRREKTSIVQRTVYVRF